ncbi:phage tail tape measure protein [Streptomyces vinaceus]|uniref:phage tail tape measure protein n=1 Tax=Streptomyces vinaceus TaxID=1960 RepID=UPI0035E0297F
MTDRTVRVVLTGNTAPYTSAMRQAAQTTQTTARQMEASMRTATNSSSAALQTMARAAETQGARAAASMNRAAGVTESQMRRVGSSGRASLNQVGTGAAQAASSMGAVNRAANLTGSQLTQLGGRGAAGVNQVSTSLGQLSSRMGAVNTAAATTAAQLTGLGTRATPAMNAVASSSASAAASVASVGSAATTAAARAAALGTAAVNVGENSKKSLKAAQTASLALVVVFGLAAAAAARFEKSMSEVRAVTGGNADDMKRLSQAALDAGQATVYSATQAANAEAELARAGISTADIIGGALRGSLDLAASGQLDLGESAVIAAQAMNAFKLKGGDVGHIADVISAGAGKSATNVHAMGLAFRQAALLSSQTGLSLEQTVGTLSLFAQNALVGSDAGTSLKVMLQRLVPQSKEAAAMMDAVGFSAYDASGNFIGLSALADNMKSSFSKLTPEARNAAMATIFGSDAVRAATILYEAGASGVDKWVSSVNDAGYATRVAATMTDNLSGDLERLKGAFETALISSGSSANSALRDMAQALTALVNWYNSLSPAVQSNVTIMAGLVGILGLVGSSLLLMLPRIMAVRAELVALGITAGTVRTALVALSRATVVLAVLAAIFYAVEKLQNAMKPTPAAVDKLTNSLLELGNTGKATGELSRRFGSNLEDIGKSLKRINDAGGFDKFIDNMYSITSFGDDWGSLAEAKDKIKELDGGLANLVKNGAIEDAADAFDRLAAVANKSGTSTEEFRNMLPGYTKALDESRMQADLTASSQKKLADSTSMTADELQDTRTQAERLTDAFKALNGVAISVAEKEISFRASLAELTDTVKENGHSLDVTSESGRKVKGAFLDAAQAAMAHAQAVGEQSQSVEAGNAVLEQDIAVLKRQMVQAGFSTGAINELIGAYAQVPTQVVTDIKAETAKAVADLQNVQDELRKTNGKSITIDALTAQAEKNLKDLGFSVVHLPDGHVTVSIPTGPPGAAIDAIQGRINNIHGTQVGVGVYLKATASDSDANGIPDLIQAARRDGGYVGYARGGHVRGYPTGGHIRGPGTGTSDSILARISNGEYVIKAASVRQYGVAMLDQLNAGRLSAAGYTARPASQYGTSTTTNQVTNNKTNNVTLNGAKQSPGEQLADVLRHLSFAS